MSQMFVSRMHQRKQESSIQSPAMRPTSSTRLVDSITIKRSWRDHGNNSNNRHQRNQARVQTSGRTSARRIHRGSQRSTTDFVQSSMQSWQKQARSLELKQSRSKIIYFASSDPHHEIHKLTSIRTDIYTGMDMAFYTDMCMDNYINGYIATDTDSYIVMCIVMCTAI